MKRAAFAAAAGLALAVNVHAQVKDAGVAVAEIEAVVTVVAIDAKARTVTFRGPKGGVATMNVPKESQNLDKVKQGDQFKVKYVEAVAVAISTGGGASATKSRDVTLAPKGSKPGGVVVQTVQISGVVDSIDYTNRYVALRGPKGNVRSLKVADDVPLQQYSAGDRISVIHTAALAMEMVEQPKKAPAKKAEKKAEKKS